MIYRRDGKIQKIAFYNNPDAALLPDDQTNPLEMRLKSFVWLIDKKPQNVDDLFSW